MRKIPCSFSMFFSIHCISSARDKGLYVVPLMDFGFTTSHNTQYEVGGFYGLYTKPAVNINYMFNAYVGITTGLGWEYFSYDVVKNGAHYEYTLYNQHVNYMEIPPAGALGEGAHKLKNRLVLYGLRCRSGGLLGASYTMDKLSPASNTGGARNIGSGTNTADMSSFVLSAKTGFGWGFSPRWNMDIIFGSILNNP